MKHCYKRLRRPQIGERVAKLADVLHNLIKTKSVENVSGLRNSILESFPSVDVSRLSDMDLIRALNQAFVKLSYKDFRIYAECFDKTFRLIDTLFKSVEIPFDNQLP